MVCDDELRMTVHGRRTPHDALELVKYALDGVGKIFREGSEFCQAGVLLTGLVPAGKVQ